MQEISHQQIKKVRKIGPYLLLKQIGRGSYSIVYEAKKQSSNERFAIKQISLVNISKRELERIHLETKVLKMIKHQNIVSMLDYKQTSRNLYLVFEHCKHTDLDSHIQKYYQGKLPQEQVRKIGIQIKRAFLVLRENKIVHRDLKLANILVTDQFEIKIADFGFAKFLNENSYFKSYVGTPLTMAPEILDKQQYNQKCDIWSLGVIFYQMLFGRNPFVTEDKMTLRDLKKAIKQQIFYPFEISTQIKDLISKMIVQNPVNRLSFEGFFSHPWLQDQGYQNMDLNYELKQQALRIQLKNNFTRSSRTNIQKQFLISHAQEILAYLIIQHIKNHIENRLMLWVNIGKKLISLNPNNKILAFLSIAVLLDNILVATSAQYVVLLNNRKEIKFRNYYHIRDLQKWQMTQFTKRLPNFLEKSSRNMHQYIKQLKINYKQLQPNKKLLQLFLIALIQEIQENNNYPNIFINTYIKIKPWQGNKFVLNVSSQAISQKTIKLLLMKMNFLIQDHKLLKKCSNIFRIETFHKQNPIDKFYEALKIKFS